MWCTGHCEIYLRWHSLQASFRILLHSDCADDTQPGRNSCPRLQPCFIVSFVLVSRKVNFFTKSAVQFVVCLHMDLISHLYTLRCAAWATLGLPSARYPNLISINRFITHGMTSSISQIGEVLIKFMQH